MATRRQHSETHNEFYALWRRLDDPRPLGRKRLGDHGWGTLCLWPKKKNFTETWVPTRTWSTLKVRPLISYHKHRYAKVYGWVSQILVDLVRRTPNCHHVDRPQEVIQKCGHFGRDATQWRGDTVVMSADIGQFFNKIPRNELLEFVDEKFNNLKSDIRTADYA